LSTRLYTLRRRFYVFKDETTMEWFEAIAGLSIVSGSCILFWAARLAFVRLPDSAVAPRRPLNMVRSLRAVLVGLSLVGLGTGLIWRNNWLVGISLIIGLEELLETTVVVMALRDETARRESDESPESG
jgi:hypothetical protein